MARDRVPPGGKTPPTWPMMVSLIFCSSAGIFASALMLSVYSTTTCGMTLLWSRTDARHLVHDRIRQRSHARNFDFHAIAGHEIAGRIEPHARSGGCTCHDDI